jgi:hypothetical protein
MTASRLRQGCWRSHPATGAGSPTVRTGRSYVRILAPQYSRPYVAVLAKVFYRPAHSYAAEVAMAHIVGTQPWPTGRERGPASPRQSRARTTHMCLRGGRWFWRRRLPVDLAAPRGTERRCKFRDIRLALRTSERAEARRRASLLDAEFERLTMNVQSGPAGNSSLGAALAAFRDYLVVEAERRRALREPDDPATAARGPALPFPAALLERLTKPAVARWGGHGETPCFR